MMQDLQRRFSIDGAVNGCTAFFALGLILLSVTRTAWVADLLMFFLGINWVIIPTNFNVATQISVPAWVKGRALSMYLTVLWGSFAIGGAVWGRVTEAAGLPVSLFSAGLIMAGLLLLAKWFPLTLSAGEDLSPAVKPGAPAALNDIPLAATAPASATGPTAVTIAYELTPAAQTDFASLAHQVGKQRLRNGASSWRLEEVHSSDSAVARYEERFTFSTAAELARQPARMTVADLNLVRRLRDLHTGPTPPVVTVQHVGLDPQELWSERFFHCVDRTLEEFEIAYNRFDRDRRNRRLKPPKLARHETARLHV